MPQPRGGRLRAPIELSCGGPRLGELSGGNWMVVVGRSLPRGGDAVTGRARLPSGSGPDLDIANFYPPSGGSCRGHGRRRLVLPGGPGQQDSYLVDSASSHMLVSKIKPCMSKYKQSYCETANGSLNQLSFI
jgi:hypothetical protein